MWLSTSQSPTTSTGATCIKCNRSVFPYQPQPIRPTRSGFSLTAAKARDCKVANAVAPATLVFKNSRRNMTGALERVGVFVHFYVSRDYTRPHRAGNNRAEHKLPAGVINEIVQMEILTSVLIDHPQSPLIKLKEYAK